MLALLRSCRALALPMRCAAGPAPAAARLFFASALLRFPKMKTHSGAKKRWRSIASGAFKRARANHSHLNVAKRPGRKNRLGLTAYAADAQQVRLKTLMPYG